MLGTEEREGKLVDMTRGNTSDSMVVLYNVCVREDKVENFKYIKKKGLCPSEIMCQNSFLVYGVRQRQGSVAFTRAFMSLDPCWPLPVSDSAQASSYEMVQARNGDQGCSAPSESGLDFQSFQDARTRKIQARGTSVAKFTCIFHRL